MSTLYKERRRNDYVVVERKGQLVPVKRKEHYRPKPQQALAVIQPQVTVLPPVRREMKTFATVTVVTKRNFWGDQVTAVDAWVDRPSSATSFLLASVFNFLTACKLRN